jgi:hypothetical protein
MTSYLWDRTLVPTCPVRALLRRWPLKVVGGEVVRLRSARDLHPGPFLLGTAQGTVRAEKDVDVETNFVQSALQISELAAWICQETGDSSGIPIVIAGALAISGSPESVIGYYSNRLRWPELRFEIKAGYLQIGE